MRGYVAPFNQHYAFLPLDSELSGSTGLTLLIFTRYRHAILQHDSYFLTRSLDRNSLVALTG
jgi:hypothetical protein